MNSVGVEQVDQAVEDERLDRQLLLLFRCPRDRGQSRAALNAVENQKRLSSIPPAARNSRPFPGGFCADEWRTGEPLSYSWWFCNPNDWATRALAKSISHVRELTVRRRDQLRDRRAAPVCGRLERTELWREPAVVVGRTTAPCAQDNGRIEESCPVSQPSHRPGRDEGTSSGSTSRVTPVFGSLTKKRARASRSNNFIRQLKRCPSYVQATLPEYSRCRRGTRSWMAT